MPALHAWINGHDGEVVHLSDARFIEVGEVDDLIASLEEAPSHVVLDLELRGDDGTVLDTLTTTIADWLAD